MGVKEVTFAEWDLYFKDATLPQSKTIDGVTRATPQYIDLNLGHGSRWKTSRQQYESHGSRDVLQMAVFIKQEYFFACPPKLSGSMPAGQEVKQPIRLAMMPQSLKEYGFFKDNSGSKFHHVGQLKPNAWGLYDMLGNLSEWTIDQYSANYYESINGNKSHDCARRQISKNCERWFLSG